MSDATFQGWIALSEKRITVVRDGVYETRGHLKDEADCIPDWAALAVLLGTILAIGGFVSAWMTDRGWATSILALGLIIAAIGMRAAESAVGQKTDWRPL
jgi:hypothetical protein